MSVATVKSPAKGVKKTKNSTGATAIHSRSGNNHAVGIGNMRVIICQEGDLWFAQGLEIDYAADGHSLEEAKKNFQDGLCSTIGLHLKAYSSIENLLKVAPQSAWKELLKEGKRMQYSQVSLHSCIEDTTFSFPSTFPFSGIDYIERKAVENV
jgi:hypothetical protein